MRLFFYNVAMTLASFPVRWWLGRHPKYHPLTARFRPPSLSPGDAPLWVQACSLGEVNTVRPLVDALTEHFPNHPVVVTSSTLTGHHRAETLFGAERVAWFPFDTPQAVDGFLARMRPVVLVLVETELWPGLLAACAQRGIPVVVVNGRLSDRHFRRYQRLRGWYRPMLASLARAGMQSERHAGRAVLLGAPEDRVRVTGNLKYDAVSSQVSVRERHRIRQESGWSPQAPILLFASTRPGDEALASACWATLREEYPTMRLVIAPRHLDRVEEVEALFSEPVLRRSAVGRSSAIQGQRVFLLDSMGELVGFMSLASVVVVGGSFYPGVNGHNPLEPAALGVPVIFGPYMANFEEAAGELVARGGAIQVACPEDLYLTLSRLLGNAGEQRQMGTRARKVVLDNQGAVRNTIALIEEALSEAVSILAPSAR